MRVGDASLLLVRLEHEQPGSALMEALLPNGGPRDGRLLDVVIVSRRSAHVGALSEIVLPDFALAGITLDTPGLIAVDDAARLTAHLDVGANAAVILVEHDPTTAASSLFALRSEQIVAVRSLPAPVANAVLDSAQQASVARPRSRSRRRCTFARPSTRGMASG